MLQDTASEVNAPSNDYWIGLVNVGDDTWTWLDEQSCIMQTGRIVEVATTMTA